MTAQGDPEKTKTALQILKAAAIGLVIILSAVAIATFIINALLGATGSGVTSTNQGSYPGGGGGYVGGRASCDGNSLTPACEPDSTRCQINEYCASDCTCVPGGGVGASCDVNHSTAACEPNDVACAQYLNCDHTACVCTGAPVITSASPAGGFCNNNKNQSCLNDTDCGTGNTCNQNTPNGAMGNFITINGLYFGTTTGSVYFSNNGNWIRADLADNASFGNPICASDVWQDNQIIAILPAGVASSSVIKVMAADTKTDTTDDDRGPTFNVTINTIDRPGVCRIDPVSGKINDQTNYYGVKMINGQAFFGDLFNHVQAGNPSFTNNTQGQAKVPNIQTGTTTTYVLKNNVSSNFLAFGKQAEVDVAPTIISFDPHEGAAGQYVTIRGTKFGATKGTNKVYFSDNTHEASYDFPAICADSIWSNNQVIVKIPTALANGNYKIIVHLTGYGDIDTSSTTPSQFNVNSALALSPSVCRIDPTMAPISSQISLWGEYFGNATGTIRFLLNHNQAGNNISYWGQDTIISTGIKPDKATTIISPLASTGPVNVVKGNPESVSNGINLTVGSCANNSQCGGTNACCPASSYKKGQCVSTSDECYTTVAACIYQWSFNTGSGISCRAGEQSCGSSVSTSTPSSCCSVVAGGCNTSQNVCTGCSAGQNLCDDHLCCNTTCADDPNNPGRTYCNATASCTGYVANQCSANFCPNVPGQCSSHSAGASTGVCDSSACHTNYPDACVNNSSCSYNSTLNKCTNSSACDLATTTLDSFNNSMIKNCVSYNGFGQWQISTTASCPTGWFSIPGNKCAQGTVGNPTPCNLCATGFTCANNNGAGICAVGNNLCPVGSICAGGTCQTSAPSCECCCRKANANADCCAPLTCDGTCGSDVGVANPHTYGMCSGCGSVGTTTAEHDAACNCSSHSGQYCDTTTITTGVCRDVATLNPVECSHHANVCCVDAENGNASHGGLGNTNIISGDTPDLAYCPYYQCLTLNPNQCDTTNPVASSTAMVYGSTSACSAACMNNPFGAGLSCQAVVSNTCNVNICSSPPYACLNNDGSGSSAPLACGTCCCVPGTTNGGGLSCRQDQSPCTGSSRGLFCGCTNNSQCSSNSSGDSCGNDTCCHAKPNIIATQPPTSQPPATGICRNALISATFDQIMNIPSFTGNMIVVGDYRTDPCPSNTTYLSSTAFTKLDLAKNWIKNKLSFIPWLGKIFYSPAEATGGNFCAVTGLVGGFNQADGKTQITFAPARLFDGSRDYYVIVKGINPDLAASSLGITSNFGISFSGPSALQSFNGINFDHSYIWHFTTKSTLSANSGLCLVDHTTLSPASYLFSTNQNDPNEKDDEDNVADSDKIFLARALSADNQVLASVTEYSWNWNWLSFMPQVADSVLVSPALSPDKKLIRAKENITDGHTTITATAVSAFTATADVPAFSLPATSTVWVFVCSNPWPSISNNGTWSPWKDTDHGSDHNFEFYYCRDRGNAGTADDLPTINSGTAATAPPTGVMKEFLFLREAMPDSLTLSTTTNTNVAQGNKAGLSWVAATVPSGETLKEYKIYYGAGSGAHTNFATTTSNSIIISGLTNGRIYYFSVTAKYNSGAESAYSNEVTFIPQDTTAPNTPVAPTVTSSAGQVRLNWTAVADAVSYKIYYGASSAVPAVSRNVGNATTYAVTNLSGGISYYFSISAIDAGGNESARSAESSATATTQ